MARSTNIYLTNKELLTEIHKSKMSYVQIEDSKYYDYDVIVYDLNVLLNDDTCTEHYGEWKVTYIPKDKKKPITETITNLWNFKNHKDADKREIISVELAKPKTAEEFIYEVKQNKAKKENKNGANPKKTPEDILTSDLVIRYMTYDHIPDDDNWDDDKDKKKVSDGYIKVNFPPFQIFVLENGVPRNVGLSHYKDGKFNLDCGKTTEKLGDMYMRLVNKISKKGSFRNYTYLDEMKCSALVQLSQVGLLFDEGRSANPNPFAFYTTVVTNVFKRVLNNEKRVRDTRDDLIEMAGHNPSYSRQSEDAWQTMTEGYYEWAENTNENSLRKKRENRSK